MKRLTLVLIALLSCAAAQPLRTHPVPTAAPPWPQDGVIPSQFSGQYVFVDPKTEDLVIAYPENLGESSFARTPSQQRTVRKVPLPNHVQPDVSVQITTQDGRLVYTYSVANRSAARDPIGQWCLALSPNHAGIEPTSQPARWNTSARLSTDFNDAYELDGSYLLTWMKYLPDGGAKQPTALRPGARLQGFTLVADKLPGVVSAYFASGPFVLVNGEEIPDAVIAQLRPVLQPFFTDRRRLTIGPVFAADTPKTEIAAQYARSIRRLVAEGELLSSSPFVAELSSRLEAYTPPASSDFIIQARPTTSKEQELATAITIAMTK